MLKTAKIKDIPMGWKFRQLIDLEEGESLSDLPIYKRVVLDKSAGFSGPKPGYIAAISGYSLTAFRETETMEIVS